MKILLMLCLFVFPHVVHANQTAALQSIFDPSANQWTFLNFWNTYQGYGRLYGRLETDDAGWIVVYNGTYGTTYETSCEAWGGHLDKSTPIHTCAFSAAVNTANLYMALQGSRVDYDCHTGIGSSDKRNACVQSFESLCPLYGGTYLGTVGTTQHLCRLP